jgi:urea transporter
MWFIQRCGLLLDSHRVSRQALATKTIFHPYITIRSQSKMGDIKETEQPRPSSGTAIISSAVKTVFRGIGQVFFQENALTGLCFTLGIALSSPPMAVAAVAGSAIGAATARILNFDRSDISAGTYGFNSALVGIAALVFFQPGLTSLSLLILGCIAASVLARAGRKYLPFPTYTVSFILITWVLYFVGLALNAPQVEPVAGPAPDGLLAAIVRGVGQVKFQANVWTGLFFLGGIALSDWRHALWVLLASALSVLGAVFHNAPAEGIALGLYGYNAPLAAIALFLWRPSLIAPLLGVLLTIPLTEYVPMLGLPALTVPFVLGTWIVLALGAFERRLSP